MYNLKVSLLEKIYDDLVEIRIICLECVNVTLNREKYTKLIMKGDSRIK